MSISIGLLGGLMVEVGGRPVDLPAATQRRALLYFAIHPNESVSVDQLADAVWPTDSPAQLGHAVHSLVYRLRRHLLGPARTEPPIVRSDPGYRLEIDPNRIDGNRFTRESSRGRAALATDPETAHFILTDALALWRGEALLDVAYDAWAAAEIRRLTELRLGACEALAEANIVLGDAQLAVAELESLTERFPLRESLWALLWRAFAASGRHLDVTASHQRATDMLTEQFGMSPSPHLAELARVYADGPA